MKCLDYKHSMCYNNEYMPIYAVLFVVIFYFCFVVRFEVG